MALYFTGTADGIVTSTDKSEAYVVYYPPGSCTEDIEEIWDTAMLMADMVSMSVPGKWTVEGLGSGFIICKND